MKNKKLLLILLAVFFIGSAMMIFLFNYQEIAWDKENENNNSFESKMINKIVNLDGYHKKIFDIGVENKNDIEYDVVDGWILAKEIVVANDRVKIGLFPYNSVVKYFEKGNFFIQGNSLCEVETIGGKKALSCVSKVDLIK